MHLKQLKLAGFKSFVDPTTVHFPSQLVAVLGPNGCGKSNIIDAVRWVMGESSAKNLRGESMTDVIFNGSTSRKPVGQASVELVFDNSLGRLVGPFASYAELSIKRVVTRDGDSTYFLNGSRCRKRDVTDVFLGTGAGARGYSIIGQGTISKLIEAKPEELRGFLEEAAGVSKYKERRRETLLRINHTQENLNRVADIRDELDKQLQRLERQAKAAERYTALKQEEALCRAEIMALKWQEFDSQQKTKQKALYDFALIYEEQQSALTSLHNHKVSITEKSHDVNDQVQNTQAQYYQIGTEVARLEEAIQQHRREQKRLEQDKQQIQSDWQKAQEQLSIDEEQLLASQQRAQDLQFQVTLIRSELSEKEAHFQESQEQMILLNEQWQEAQAQFNTVKNELQLTTIKKQHSEQNRQQLLVRLEKIHNEKNTCSLDDLERTQLKLKEQLIEYQEQKLSAEECLKLENEKYSQARTKLQDTELEINKVQKEFNQLYSELMALEAIQKAAMQNNEHALIGTKGPSDQQLIEVLKVESAWQFACERVLTDDLHAYVIEDFSLLWSKTSEEEQLGFNVVSLIEATKTKAIRPRLVDKILGPIPLTAHPLESIYTAKSLEQAQQWLPELLPHESIITLSGTWLGLGWIKLVSSQEQEEIGLLARQQKIVELALIVNQQKLKLKDKEDERESYYQQVQATLTSCERLQQNLNSTNETVRTGTLALERNQLDCARVTQLLMSFAIQEEELGQDLEDLNHELSLLYESAGSLNCLVQEHQQRFTQLNLAKEQQKNILTILQQTVDSVRTKLHQAELEAGKETTKIVQYTQGIEKEKERLLLLLERLEHMASVCLQSTLPEQQMQERLNEQLLKHNEIEAQLSNVREQLSLIKIELEDVEKQILDCSQENKKIQETMAQLRMQEQELAVRGGAIQESLTELKLNAVELLTQIKSGITQEMREDELGTINEKIKRLGAINLAAIEEFTSEQQRKTYLDEQHADLSEAINTLQKAIDKMDKETRQRLESTFDEVNASFKALFPRLFGGGRARLELTCDNLLEAGIVVMAQPPGKRNSTIHLLSGGEKAMTAVALVFAIFQLNPSPFCMLDEVDAPLDDVNVGRFCALVKEMSQFVQFLFITHNKVTMELADQLIGVTMREPGVSRLVTVDVNETLTME